MEHERSMPVRLCSHEVNQGLGATLRDGLLDALGRAAPDDVIVTMDADGTHHPSLVPRMVAAIAEGSDVVVASRYRPGARSVGVPYGRRMLSRIASLVFRGMFPIVGIRDYTCGYRAYRARSLLAARERWGEAFPPTGGFEASADILLWLGALPLRFAEVPLDLRYDLKDGPTKMNVARTVRGTLRLLARRRLDRSR
jgi:dolichol-phosphate mannosyltransferase